MPSQTMVYTEKVKKIFELTKPNFNEMLDNTVKILINYGGCPYRANTKETSAVLKASACADVTNLAVMCKAKPSAGADVNLQNEHGETALMAAIKSLETKLKQDKPNTRKEEVDVEGVNHLLRAKADPNFQFDDGDTVLMRIIKISYFPLLASVLANTIVPINHNAQNRSKYSLLLIRIKQLNILLLIVRT